MFLFNFEIFLCAGDNRLESSYLENGRGLKLYRGFSSSSCVSLYRCKDLYFKVDHLESSTQKKRKEK